MQPEVAPVLRSFLGDLVRRKLGHWALAYLAGAWLLLQVLDLLDQPFAWPSQVLRVATVLLAIGFFAALVVAWYHGERGAQRVSGVELLMLTGILVLAAAAVALVGRAGRPDTSAATGPSGLPGAAAVGAPMVPGSSGGSVPGATGGAGSAPGGGAAVPAGFRGAPAVVEQGSIAVLPFVNMSSDREQEYFSDGLTEELLNVLAQIPALRVASRTSAFAFKGKDVPLDSIARALHVHHVLEGSVRKSGERIRVTAQLVDAASGYHLWSQSYDRALRDVFAVQDEIARAVVAQLRIRLSADLAASPLARAETSDPAAHTMLLRGLAARHLYTPAGVTESIRLLREAARRDAGYARAHAELAGSLWLASYDRFIPPRSGYREARTEAERALALDPSLAEADYVLGRIAAWNDWDWPIAEQRFRSAIESNPNLALAHSWLARLLALRGRPDEAIPEARRATELDPLSAELRCNLATVYLFAGDRSTALRELQNAAALGGTQSFIVLVNLAWAFAFVGRSDDALQTARQAQALLPRDAFAMGTLAYAAARAGRRPQARQLLGQIESARDASPYVRAVVHAELGETDRAFALLERAVDTHDDFAAEIAVDPALDRLRGDPRLARLLRRAGLSE